MTGQIKQVFSLRFPALLCKNNMYTCTLFRKCRNPIHTCLEFFVESSNLFILLVTDRPCGSCCCYRTCPRFGIAPPDFSLKIWVGMRMRLQNQYRGSFLGAEHVGKLFTMFCGRWSLGFHRSLVDIDIHSSSLRTGWWNSRPYSLLVHIFLFHSLLRLGKPFLFLIQFLP